MYAAAPLGAEPEKDARSKLVLQYSIGVGIGLALVVATAVWASLSSPSADPTNLGSPATTSSSAAPTTEKTTTKKPSPAESTVPSTGPEDGVTPDITFLITAIDTASTVTSPSNELLTKEAQGEFIIVSMDVTDTGSGPATYVASLQKLLAGGTAYDADPEATNYLSTVYEDLTPGDKISTVIVYDVPPGTVPDGIELHGDTIGPGITVPFQ